MRRRGQPPLTTPARPSRVSLQKTATPVSLSPYQESRDRRQRWVMCRAHPRHEATGGLARCDAGRSDWPGWLRCDHQRMGGFVMRRDFLEAFRGRFEVSAMHWNGRWIWATHPCGLATLEVEATSTEYIWAESSLLHVTMR